MTAVTVLHRDTAVVTWLLTFQWLSTCTQHSAGHRKWDIHRDSLAKAVTETPQVLIGNMAKEMYSICRCNGGPSMSFWVGPSF